MAEDAQAQPQAEEAAEGKGAVSAGRGVLFIAAAKIYFMMAGAAIEFALPRLVGRFVFGAYGLVATYVSLVNGVMVTGTIQAVSRYTTERPERAAQVRGAGFRMHLMFGLPVALAYAAAAPLIAWLARDTSKTVPIAVSAGIILVYAFYSVLVGSANGQRHFHKQAGLDTTAATLRAIAILGLSAAGFGVLGAIGGWVLASIAVFLVAAVWVGLPRGVERDRVFPMLRFFGGVAGYLAVMQCIQASDTVLLKPLSTGWFRDHTGWLSQHSEWFRQHWWGLDWHQLVDRAAAHESDGQVGFYRAVQNLARLPYQLMIAVTFVVFPLVSRATFQGDKEKTRGYIRTTLRYSLIFAAAMGTALAANPAANLDIIYKPEYAREGGAALSVLALGNVAFAVFTIAGTILNGAGKTLQTVTVSLATLAVSVTALAIGVPRAAPGHDVLLVSAAATTAAMVVGAAAFGVLLYRQFGAFIPILTLIRVGVAVAAAFGAARFLPLRGPIVTAGEAAVAGIVYLLVLVLTGELGRADLRAVRRST